MYEILKEMSANIYDNKRFAKSHETLSYENRIRKSNVLI